MPRRAVSAFTLIELMVAVCILGVLASIALPTYQRFINEARGTEGVSSLSAIYKGAVAYFNRPMAGKGLAGTGIGHCMVKDHDPTPERPPFPPMPYKRTGDFAGSETFKALGFSPGPVYFIYIAGGMIPPGGAPWADECNVPDIDPAFGAAAACDLNGDGTIGGYFLMAGVRDGQMFRHLGLQDISLFWQVGFGAACPVCGPGIN